MVPGMSEHTIGCLVALTGCSIAGVTHGLEKIILQSMGAYELSCIRNIVTLVIFVIYFKCNNIKLNLPWKTHVVMFSMSILKALVPYLRNLALMHISLSEFTALMFSDLIYIGPMSAIWYRKCLTLYDIIGIIVSITGTVLVCQLEFFLFDNDSVALPSSQRSLSICYGIVATFLSIVHTFSVREYKEVPIPYMLIMLNTSGIIFGVTMILIGQESTLMLPSSFSLYAMISAMLVVMLGYKIMEFKAKKMIEPHESTIMSTFEFVVAFVFQFLVFGKLPGRLEVIGDILIFVAIMSFALKDVIKNRPHAFGKKCNNSFQITKD